MQTITKEAVFAEHEKTPRRKCFLNETGLQIRKNKPTFSVSIPSAKAIFEVDTNLNLKYNPQYDNYWSYIDDRECEIIEAWEKQQGSLVFLRDCLSCSLALDCNFTGEAGNYTEIGRWEHEAKAEQDQSAIKNLADKAAQTIQNLPFYKEADCICAVPSAKEFDLPRAAVSQISTLISKPDITGHFHFGGDKKSVKAANIENKWDIWDNAGLSFNGSIQDKSVILIDDKYQAGITLQYVAMKLQEAGASEVYGLCFVKTWGDQDNQRW